MGMVSQMIHLEPAQKDALKQRARQSGRSLSAEIRLAIDTHLDHVDETSLAELNLLSQQAAGAIDQMQQDITRVRAKLTKTFAAIESLRVGD